MVNSVVIAVCIPTFLPCDFPLIVFKIIAAMVL